MKSPKAQSAFDYLLKAGFPPDQLDEADILDSDYLMWARKAQMLKMLEILNIKVDQDTTWDKLFNTHFKIAPNIYMWLVNLYDALENEFGDLFELEIEDPASYIKAKQLCQNIRDFANQISKFGARGNFNIFSNLTYEIICNYFYVNKVGYVPADSIVAGSLIYLMDGKTRHYCQKSNHEECYDEWISLEQLNKYKSFV